MSYIPPSDCDLNGVELTLSEIQASISTGISCEVDLSSIETTLSLMSNDNELIRKMLAQFGFQINQINSNIELTNWTIADLYEFNKKCCEGNFKNWSLMFRYLEEMRRKVDGLLLCCEEETPPPTPPLPPVRPVLEVGQAIRDITDFVVPKPVVKPKPVESPFTTIEATRLSAVAPVAHNESLIMYYNVDKGYFPIPNVMGSWIIDGRSIKNKEGVDLINYMPIDVNYRIKEVINRKMSLSGNSDIYDSDITLVDIFGYVIKDTPNGRVALLKYKTRDNKTGVVKTFESDIYKWSKWSNLRR